MKHTTLFKYAVALLILLATNAQLQALNRCDSLLHIAIEASIEKDYLHSLELLYEAQDIAKQKNGYEQQFWVLTNIGINYAEMMDYGTALNNLSAAYKLAVDKLDGRHELSVLNNIAGVYMLDKKYDKALEQFKIIYKKSLNSNDSTFMGGCAMNIANASMRLNDLEQTEEYIETAEQMLEGNTLGTMELQVLKANLLRKKDKFAESYEIALRLINTARAEKNRALETAALIILAHTMYDLKDYHASVKYANEALQYNIGIEERKNLYNTLSQAFFHLKKYEKGFAYKDSVVQMTDSIWHTQEERQFENANIQIELLKRENEIEEYRLRTRNSHILLISGIFAAAILAWALINQMAKNRQEKQISQLQIEREKQQQQLLKNQLEEQRTKALLEEERYKHEIEIRDKKLMSKAMIVANRNDIVANIIDTLSHTKFIKESSDINLKQAISQLQHTLDDKGAWEDFATYFEQRNEAFIAALRDKHPELNANEIRFLSLVYTNLSTKEIAALLNITPEYCKKKRQQLARKMGFENSKTLFSYLSTIA